ncbi:hypothetical protein FQN57_005360 [Myotisia sp. PD_48]|nr:hypothetical protein FQN57_005360 [Myotisia sp. PD_48]
MTTSTIIPATDRPSRSLFPSTNIKSSAPAPMTQDAPLNQGAPHTLSPATADSAERPKKKRSFLRIPSRSSSNKKPKEPIVSVEGAQGGSAASLATSRTRSHSKASSKRSRHVSPSRQQEGQVEVKPSSSQAHRVSSPERKPKPSKLLAFLSCCSPSHEDTDDSVSIPSKQPVKPHAGRTRQSVPTEKSEPATAESSRLERNDANNLNEKATLKLASEQSIPNGESNTKSYKPEGQQQQTSITKPSNDGDSTLASVPSGESHNSEARAETGKQPLDVEKPLPEPSGAANATSFSDNTKPSEQPSSSSDYTANMPETIQPQATAHEPKPVPNNDSVRQSNLPPPPPPLDRAQSSDQHVPPVPAVRDEKQKWLLPPIQAHFQNKKCLILDLDETLVHSSFKILDKADFTIPVEIEGQFHNIYVIKRPGVDQFMKRVGELYEVVVFTASVSKYGDPLLDKLDIHHVVHHRLFRDSCYNHQGNYVKDLSQVGRDLKETIIIDNSPTSYIFHPKHAIPISSWFSDAHDNELLDLIPVLEDLATSQVRDVSLVLDVSL